MSFSEFEIMGIFHSKDRAAAEEAAYLEMQAKYIEQQKKAQEDINNHMNEYNNLVRDQYEEQIKQAKQKIADIEDTIRTAEEMREEKKARYTRTSVLICALLYNYPFGTVLPDDEDNIDIGDWTSSAEKILNMCVQDGVFKLLCRIPMFLPTIWPIGEGDEKFHEYPEGLSAMNDADIGGLYIRTINTYIEEYLPRLKRRLNNVFRLNTTAGEVTNDDDRQVLNTLCAAFIKLEAVSQSDNEFVDVALNFLKDVDNDVWRTMAAKTLRGIMKTPIRVLPSCYPRICRKYEFFNSLLMLCNAVFWSYGRAKSAQGNDIIVDIKIKKIPEPAIKGGQCFDMNKDWYAKSNELAYKDRPESWDYSSFKRADIHDAFSIEPQEITGIADDATWMKDVKLCNELQLYQKKPDISDGATGIVRYVNPTFKYTRTYLCDTGKVDTPFTMPRLSASTFEGYSNEVPMRIFNLLQLQDGPLEHYNSYTATNSQFMTMFDFLTTTPPDMQDWKFKGAPPLSTAIYKCIIETTCDWEITYPIDNTMSMGKINYKLLQLFDGRMDMLPIYLYTANEHIKFHGQNTAEKNLDKLEETKLLTTAEVTKVLKIGKQTIQNEVNKNPDMFGRYNYLYSDATPA